RAARRTPCSNRHARRRFRSGADHGGALRAANAGGSVRPPTAGWPRPRQASVQAMADFSRRGAICDTGGSSKVSAAAATPPPPASLMVARLRVANEGGGPPATVLATAYSQNPKPVGALPSPRGLAHDKRSWAVAGLEAMLLASLGAAAGLASIASPAHWTGAPLC